jgi:MFS family permease
LPRSAISRGLDNRNGRPAQYRASASIATVYGFLCTPQSELLSSTAWPWELYAVWSLVAVYFSAFFAARRGGGEVLGSLAGFATIAIGGVGCVVAGAWADRLGRERVAGLAMVVSGACSLVIGWLMSAPAVIVVSLALIWGFAVVADSAQFSALVTEVAPKHAVGTALTLQTSLGFALTAVSIWATIEIAERFGWGPAFSLLAIGPVFGIVSMVRLQNVRSLAAPKGANRGARRNL